MENFFDPRYAELPYRRFMEFISAEADRFCILSSLLRELKLNSTVLPLAGNRHFLILPPGRDLRAGFPFRGQNPVILIAHYDRVPGSSGANDNSAAVFQLMQAAAGLSSVPGGAWMIFFTDKEEVRQGEGINSQGSYSLAAALQEGGLSAARVFVFDACGAGDTLVISTAAELLFKNEESPPIRKTREIILGLRNHALLTANALRLDRVCLLPTPFSDDAGFLKAGLPAQTITVLPRQEAELFAERFHRNPELAAAIISREQQDKRVLSLIPDTWRALNGPGDSYLRLTPHQFGTIIRFAQALCGIQ